MLAEFRKYSEENSLFNHSDKLLLAVSGGIDSMVMTDLFIKTGSNIGIAHCNFNLRGTESDRDEAFVKRFAFKNGLPFHRVSFDTTGYAGEKGISIQMAARELRYRWFEEIRSRNGYDFIVLAHNMNDNIETFLINLTRGTGLAGLTGMKPKFKKLVRPLLFASRNSINQYCKENKVKFREDRSNSEIKYTRNKIRHQILPLFREINPSFDDTITGTSERFGEINEIVTSYISDIRKRAVYQKDNLTMVKIRDIKDIPSGSTILYELLRPYGVVSSQVQELVKLSEGKTGSQLFTRTSRIVKNRNEIIIMPVEPEIRILHRINTVDEFPGIFGFKSARIKNIDKSFTIPSSERIACLDADKVKFPLIIRKWAHGDFFYPLGMKSKKKLSDYFVDRKYSVPEKEKQLILESRGKIVWIIGERIDNRFRITGETKKALMIRTT